MNRRLISRILCVSLGVGILLPMGACRRTADVKWFPKESFLWVKIHWTKIEPPNDPVPDKFVGCVAVEAGLTLDDVAVYIDDALVAIGPVSNLDHEGLIGDELPASCYAPGTDTIVCYETVSNVDLSDGNSLETIYSLTNGGTAFSTTTCGGGTTLADLTEDSTVDPLIYSSFEKPVSYAPVPLPLCEAGNGNLGCAAGCLPDACGGDDAADCATLAANATLDEVTNLDTIDLALVQKDYKINKFQQWTLEILKKRGVQFEVINTRAEALQQISKKKGVHVAIFGHGDVGEIKIGEFILDQDTAEAFGTDLKGQVKALSLFGCKTGANQKFLKIITDALQRPVHAWEGKVYAFGNDEGIPVEMRNKFFTDPGTDKKEIPTVSEWGMAVMCLLVLTAGTVVVMRRRAIVMA